MKNSWLLLMSFDEHDGSPNEIKTLYHKKSKKEMTKMMNLLQDMNEHLVLSLVQIDPTSTYEDIIRVGDSEMYFMDSKKNWNNGKTLEELEEEAFEEMLMGSVLNGDMGYA
jgi:hypothetical protein